MDIEPIPGQIVNVTAVKDMETYYSLTNAEGLDLRLPRQWKHDWLTIDTDGTLDEPFNVEILGSVITDNGGKYYTVAVYVDYEGEDENNNEYVNTCARCESKLEMYGKMQPINGMHVRLLDGYSMFTDNFEEGLPDFLLCHSCMLWFLVEFPDKFKANFNGGHPAGFFGCDGCEYSWTRDAEQ